MANVLRRPAPQASSPPSFPPSPKIPRTPSLRSEAEAEAEEDRGSVVGKGKVIKANVRDEDEPGPTTPTEAGKGETLERGEEPEQREGWEESPLRRLEVRPGRTLAVRAVAILPRPPPPPPLPPTPAVPPSPAGSVVGDLPSEAPHESKVLHAMFAPVRDVFMTLSHHGHGQRQKATSGQRKVGGSTHGRLQGGNGDGGGGGGGGGGGSWHGWGSGGRRGEGGGCRQRGGSHHGTQTPQKVGQGVASASALSGSGTRTPERLRREAQERVLRVTEPPVPPTPPKAPVVAEFLFVHGACGNMRQFDRLLGELHARLRPPEEEEEGGAPGKDEGAEDGGGNVPGAPLGASPKTSGGKGGGGGRRSRKELEELKGLDILGGGIKCVLFDALGCGLSKHDPDDWDAYSSEALLQDLEGVLDQGFQGDKEGAEPAGDDGNEKAEKEGKAAARRRRPPLFVVAHSYGASQAVQLAHRLSQSQHTTTKPPRAPPRRIAGLVLLSGAVAGGPSSHPSCGPAGDCGPAADGGHCLFRLPLWALRWLRPHMDRAFVDAAYPPPTTPEEDTDEEKSGRRVALRSAAASACAANSLSYSRAFHRQTRWVDPRIASRVDIHALVVHGSDDAVLPPANGEALYEALPDAEMVEIKGGGHFVMEERPEEVAGLVLRFVGEVLEEEGRGAE